uniref:Secreted protein n=1 Tax=Oryza punctata TaxID=4537 RepID=A0A0E0K9G4_ORYPU
MQNFAGFAVMLWVLICGRVLSPVSSICSLLEMGAGARDNEWTALPIDQEHVPDSHSLETRKKEPSHPVNLCSKMSMKTIGESLYIAVGRGPGPVWGVGQAEAAAAVRVVTCNHPFRIEFGGGGGERGPASSEWHPLRSATTMARLFGVASDQIRLRHLPLPRHALDMGALAASDVTLIVPFSTPNPITSRMVF